MNKSINIHFFLIIIFIIYFFINLNTKKCNPAKNINYRERYNYIIKNMRCINKSLNKISFDKTQIIEKLGLPYNDIDENCWIWLEPSSNDTYGRKLKDCNYRIGGLYLDFQTQSNEDFRLRSIAGNWEYFQDILKRPE